MGEMAECRKKATSQLWRKYISVKIWCEGHHKWESVALLSFMARPCNLMEREPSVMLCGPTSKGGYWKLGRENSKRDVVWNNSGKDTE